jgi:hypothetical protein
MIRVSLTFFPCASPPFYGVNPINARAVIKKSEVTIVYARTVIPVPQGKSVFPIAFTPNQMSSRPLSDVYGVKLMGV